MENQQYELNFYHIVELPGEVILNIVSFLSMKKQASWMQLCEISNQTVKYAHFDNVYYGQSNKNVHFVKIASISPIISMNNRVKNAYHYHVSLRHYCGTLSSYEKQKINFRDLSLDENKTRFVVVLQDDHDYNNDDNNAKLTRTKSLEKKIIQSLLRNSRLTKILSTIEHGNNKITQFVSVDFSFQSLMCEANKDEEIEWKFKLSNSNDEWKSFDAKIFNIEQRYKNKAKQMKYVVDNIVNGKKSMYIIYFDKKKNVDINNELKYKYKRNGTYKVNNHRLLEYAYTHWKHPFTQYFYQQNVTTQNYRIVKRENKTKVRIRNNFQNKNIIENYFGTNFGTIHNRCIHSSFKHLFSSPSQPPMSILV